MRFTHVRFSLSLLSLVSLASAVGWSCGDGGTATTSGSPDGAGGTGGGGGPTTGTTETGGGGSGSGLGSGVGGFEGCASGIICGNGNCCAGGEECIADACVTACPTQVRCGADNSLCCAAEELCLGEACVAAKGPCLDWADCDDGEFCEPTLGKCVPDPPGAPTCEVKPAFGPLTPTIEWQWTESPIFPAANQVINMPVVMDLDVDAIPDVVIVTSDSFNANAKGYLRALNGKDGTEKWDMTAGVYQPGNEVNPRGTPAVADLDGDGFVEIVTPKSGGGLIAFNHDGSLLWTSTMADGTTPYKTGLNSGTVAIADLDADGSPEVVVAGLVFDATGKLIANNGELAGGHPFTNYGAVSIVADLDGDGTQEVVTGRAAYDMKGTHVLWDNGKSDGYPAIADLDGDGTPEIVVVSNSTVRVQGPGGEVLATMPFPMGPVPAAVTGLGGPPTIADFNGDGKPDFATAGGNGYMVFTYDPGNTPAISLLWSSVTQDLSSNRTGSSVFDFQGDGSAEVVYGDECYFRIYDGKTGAVLFETPSSSGTIHEYPVVADVDGDNNTEIVVVSNDLNHNAGTCPKYVDGQAPRHGVFLYGDAEDQWVRTRRIWNQHAYHITNISANGSVPQPESVSWKAPQGLNNYRQSSQGAGVFNAPDLKVSLSASLASCPTAIKLSAQVQNRGSLGVAPGVNVTFYAGTSAAGTMIGSAKTTKALLPGQSEDVSFNAAISEGDAPTSFFVTVDGDPQGMSEISECLEDNNDAGVDGVVCPMIN